ncbi:hypothetical protein HYW19_01450 [Candidatus Woesearchaeota archaeon]|nr:hypothetical protein [Candidatus Woesearchaeota archaeon]
MKTKVRIWTNVFIFFLLIFSVNSIQDSNPSNNILNLSVTVIQTKNITMVYRPVDDISLNDFTQTRLNYENFTLKTFPVQDNGLIVNATFSKISVPDNSILTDRQLGDLLDDLQTKADLAGSQYIIGIVRADWIQDRLNKSATGLMSHDYRGVSLAEAGQIKTSTHELSHHKPFILCEEYSDTGWEKLDNKTGFQCPNGDDPDIAGRQLKTACSQNVGENDGCRTNTFAKLYQFDEINDTTTLYNFMGGADNPNVDGFRSWISNETYDVLLGELSGTKKRGLLSIIIRWYHFENGTSEFKNAYVTENLFESTQSEFLVTDGNYTIRTLNDTNVTQNITYDVFFEILYEGGVLEPTSVVAKSVILPYSDNVNNPQSEIGGILELGGIA